MEVTIGGADAGRMEFELYADVSFLFGLVDDVFFVKVWKFNKKINNK